MFVYIMKGEVSGHLKVGFSGNVLLRQQGVQFEASEPVTILYTRECNSIIHAQNVEAHSHTLLMKSHVRGEWFGCSPEEAMTAVDEAHGIANTDIKEIRSPIPRSVKRAIIRDARILFRVDPDLKRAIEEAAAKDDRTVANWIERTLREKLGITAPPPARPAGRRTSCGS